MCKSCFSFLIKASFKETHTHVHTHYLTPKSKSGRSSQCLRPAGRHIAGAAGPAGFLSGGKYGPHPHWENDPASRNRIMLTQHHPAPSDSVISFCLLTTTGEAWVVLQTFLSLLWPLTKRSFESSQTYRSNLNVGAPSVSICRKISTCQVIRMLAILCIVQFFLSFCCFTNTIY